MAKYKIIPSSRTIVQSPISIGHKAEKGVEAIEFDLTAWVETYGSGTLTVIMRRWGDAIPYPIALEIDENNKATWTLSDTDTAKAGMAYAQLSYIVGDEVVKKSDIYTFRVMDSLIGEGEPPEAYESWLEHLTHLAAEAMAEVLDIEGVVTDKTLTVDGGIADAKATGDALSALEDAVTEETDKLKADKAYGMDIVKAQGSFNTNTHNGITFTWDREKQSCTVSGTATARANNNIYGETKYLPDGINPGDNIIVRFHADSSKVYLRSIFWDDTATMISNTSTITDIPVRVPENAVGWTLKLNVESGNTLTNVRVDRIQAVKIHARKMDVPLIVSFVDDDTTADQYVTRFHDNCCHNGVLGNFAVIASHIEDGDTNLSTLLDYQDEGFGMLLHCYAQKVDGTNYWNASPRTKAQTNQCRANLIRAIQYMQNNGFVNYRHWITPGGHHDDGLAEVAKQLGFNNLISINNDRENAPQDCNKWFIKRVAFKHDDTSSLSTLAKVKKYIDATVVNGSGWLIITTHFNAGWEHLTGVDAWDDTLDANGYPIGYPRFNEMVQYALSKGMVPMSVPEAWEYYSPILEANYAEVTVAN